ncbi:unnamed protein product [Lymnaea stagnalis]|uniref:Cyclin-dependent kinase-like 2 n=1 Tax=Lymnaea stagnalis TaxID=6523 RepID=A0AAV2H9L1_LYMST
MDRYENLGLVGEGSYGMVLKCRHKETGQLVAIKKFLESEDDKVVQKIALREVKMLKQLQHDNLVNLIETFRRRKRLYLVFEFVDHTILDELEKCPNGLDENSCRKILWQVLKGTEFCHSHNIIHRDIKPENILISKSGIIKICDFGFARTLAQPGETYTDYVATRWYRAPELLVGDTKYGRAVDIWAIGCLLYEIITGEPLFPGDSDIDQLYHIIRCFGNLPQRHKEVFHRNPLFVGMRLPEVRDIIPLEKKITKVSPDSLNFMKQCLQLDPEKRPTCTQLLKHNLFLKDGFGARFIVELRQKIYHENVANELPKSSPSTIKADQEKTTEEDENENSKVFKVIAKKKKKPEPKKDETKSDEKTLKKILDTENKSYSKESSLKPTAATPVISFINQPMTLPPAANSATFLSANLSQNNANEGEFFTEKDNRDRDKDARDHITQAHHLTPSNIPPITTNTQTRAPVLRTFLSPAIAKVKTDEKWSPRNPLGNRTSTFRVNEKARKVTRLPKKSPSKVPQYRYSSITSPQPITVEKNSIQEKSRSSVEKLNDERPGLSLPEVKGADAASTRAKDKQQSPYKKSSVSSIPHISNMETLTSSSSQLDNSLTHEKEVNSTLPNV